MTLAPNLTMKRTTAPLSKTWIEEWGVSLKPWGEWVSGDFGDWGVSLEPCVEGLKGGGAWDSRKQDTRFSVFYLKISIASKQQLSYKKEKSS
jgi:hypothetical protein